MIPRQLIAPGQLTDPGVNFTWVHGLTPVTVHMSFSLPRGNFERWVTRCPTPVDSCLHYPSTIKRIEIFHGVLSACQLNCEVLEFIKIPIFWINTCSKHYATFEQLEIIPLHVSNERPILVKLFMKLTLVMAQMITYYRCLLLKYWLIFLLVLEVSDIV